MVCTTSTATRESVGGGAFGFGRIIHDGETTGEIINLIRDRTGDFNLYHMDPSQYDPRTDPDGNSGHAGIDILINLTLFGQ